MDMLTQFRNELQEWADNSEKWSKEAVTDWERKRGKGNAAGTMNVIKVLNSELSRRHPEGVPLDRCLYQAAERVFKLAEKIEKDVVKSPGDYYKVGVYESYGILAHRIISFARRIVCELYPE